MSDVAEVKSRINIVDVVGDYLRLERAGAGSWKGLCPFHQEKSPSFTVSEERQLWHCFGCSRGGDLFSFVMEKEGMDFREVLIALAERAGVELTNRRDSANSVTSDQKNTIRKILELSAQFFAHQLRKSDGGSGALDYLHGRALSDGSIEKFAIGFAPDGWRYLTDFLISRKFSVGDIVASGMAIAKSGDPNSGKSDSCYDRFRGRIMFPITDPLGRVIGFSGRIMPGGDDKTGKYINSPETAVYHKSAVLYGIAQAKDAIKQVGEVVIVEGQMDVIAAHQAEIAQTVAVSGTALTPTHAGIIRRYARTVTLFFDNDTAGRAAGIKSVAVCVAAGLAVKMVTIQSGKDAAEIVAEDPEILRTAIANARVALEVIFDDVCAGVDIATPAGKRAVIAQMVPLIAAHSSLVEREYWIGELVVRAGVSLAAATEAVTQAVSEAERPQSAQNATTNTVIKDKDSAQSDTFTLLSDALIQSVIYNPAAMRALTTQNIPDELKANLPIISYILANAQQAEYDFAQIIASCTDEKMHAQLEQKLRKSSPVSLDREESEITTEIAQLVSRLLSAHQHNQRTQIIAQLAQAESTGDKQRTSELLAKLQSYKQ